jgi:hypothetical protein
VGVAGVDVVEEGDVEILGDEQREAHDAQVGPLLLALAPLGQGRGRIEAIDEGIEVRRVVQQAGELDLEALDEGAGEVLLDGADFLGIEVAQVVPEALAGELAGRDGQEAAQDGALIPLRQPGLAGRGQAAVQGRQGDVGAHAHALGALARMAVNGRDELQLLRQVIQGGGCGEVPQDDFPGRRRHRRGPHGRGDALRLAEVLLPDDLRFPLHALAFARVPVGVTPDQFLLEADRHD